MQLSDFKTYVKRDFKRTDKDTEIVDAYNDMVMWIAVRMPHGNYKFQSYVNCVVGQEDYPIPSNLIHIQHPVRLLIGTGSSDSGYDLRHVSKEEYDIWEPNPNRTSPATGRPEIYTIFSRSILVSPVADDANNLLEINWAKRPTDQSGDTDTTDLPEEWDETLKHGTLERLYSGLGMIVEAQFWAGKYRDERGEPVGMCKVLFDSEQDREGSAVGQVKANEL